MNEDEWQPIDTAPYDETVWTKVHDKDGERTIACLKCDGAIWYTVENMPAYYTPTHWRREYPWDEVHNAK